VGQALGEGVTMALTTPLSSALTTSAKRAVSVCGGALICATKALPLGPIAPETEVVFEHSVTSVDLPCSGGSSIRPICPPCSPLMWSKGALHVRRRREAKVTLSELGVEGVGGAFGVAAGSDPSTLAA
jgi:hypothetical protein